MDDGTGLHIYRLHSNYGNYNFTGYLTLGSYRHSLRTLGRIRRQYVPECIIFSVICTHTNNTHTKQCDIYTIQSCKMTIIKCQFVMQSMLHVILEILNKYQCTKFMHQYNILSCTLIDVIKLQWCYFVMRQLYFQWDSILTRLADSRTNCLTHIKLGSLTSCLSWLYGSQ